MVMGTLVKGLKNPFLVFLADSLTIILDLECKQGFLFGNFCFIYIQQNNP